jgi:Alkylmercury lyase
LILPGGRERYACYAVDALGIVAMLRERVDIRARCHHCGEPLAFAAAAARPSPESEGVMV